MATYLYLLMWSLVLGVANAVGPTTGHPRQPVLHIAGLFPMTSDLWGDVGPGVLPAVELALQHVNQREVLEGYRLELAWNDSQCDMAVGTKLFFDMMHTLPAKVMLFGDACSHVTGPVAESSIWWNISQLSYADTNPTLSDRAKYPNFFRTVPSDSEYNPARIQLLRRFHWTRVGTLFQDASRGSSRYSYSHNKLIDLLDMYNIERVTQSFSSDPKPALTNLKRRDVRVIIGNFDEEMARKVFCSVYQEQLYGPKYVWLILGDYSDSWWRHNDTGCSPDELQVALQGVLTTDVLPLRNMDDRTISNLTVGEYEQFYNERRDGDYSKFHGYAYDGIWVVAMAIDNVIRQNGGIFELDDFRGEKIRTALNETNFIGVTGKVTFKNGDRVGSITFKQFQDEDMVAVGQYHAHANNLDLLDDRLIWHGKGPPRDRTLQHRQMHRVNLTIYATLCTLASFGIVMGVFFLAVNVRFRNHKYIKMSSPNMNNIIIAGCLLAYIGVFLLGTDGRLVGSDHFPVMCSARAWVLSIGFTLSFGAMFSKTWRVHSIFTNITLNRKVIKDYKLFFMVAVFLVVDITILSVWQLFDPARRLTKELQPQSHPTQEDVEIVPVIEYCISDHMTVWSAVIYAYKGLMLLFGCFLAWETRHVSVPALNDSKYVGMSVYNIVIMCVAGVPISFIIKDRPDAAYLIIALFIIFCTTITLCLVFVPKLVELRRDPKGDEKRMRATFRKNSVDSCTSQKSKKMRHLSEENYRYRQLLEEKTKQIAKLLDQLDEDSSCSEAGDLATYGNRFKRTFHNIRNHRTPVRLLSQTSEDTYFSDDDSLVSPSSVTNNLWARSYPWLEIKSNGDPVRPHSLPNHNSSNDVRDCSHRKVGMIPDFGVTKYGRLRLEPIYSSCEDSLSGGHAFNRPELESSGRTPSYQGLKFLTYSDLFNLRETAILSDSGPEDKSEGGSIAGKENDTYEYNAAATLLT